MYLVQLSGQEASAPLTGSCVAGTVFTGEILTDVEKTSTVSIH